MKSGWDIRRLGDVCTIEKVQGVHLGLPYVGLEDIESGTAQFLGSYDPLSVKSSTFKFTPDHILYGRLRPYLNKALAPNFEGHCSTEIFPLRPASHLSREYLLYWLLADETVERINATSRGARMPRANMNDVMDFEFLLPPLPEQLRVVGILDEALDGLATATANAEQNLKNARALFETKLNDVFTRRGEGWAEMPLSDLCEIKHGFAFDGEFFSNSGDFVLLTPGNFYEKGGYRDRGAKQKYYAGPIPRDYVLTKGDLLVAMTEQAAGLLGSPIIVPESDKFLHNQRLGLVRKREGVPLLNEFFFYAFNTRRVRRDIHASASGVKVRHTSPTKIGEVSVAFPTSITEQRRIAATLSKLHEQIQRLESAYRQKLDAFDALKKSILHKAISGNL